MMFALKMLTTGIRSLPDIRRNRVPEKNDKEGLNMEENLNKGAMAKASRSYKDGDTVHDYCPWCGCAAEGKFSSKAPHTIAGYEVKMKCTSCGKTFYHSYE